MNQDKFEVVKQMARVNTDILGISELKWTGMGEFNSDDHYTYYCGQESLRRNGVAIMVNKRVQNAVLGCNLKNDRMISVRFQGKPFNIIVIQVYAPISNAEEAEVEWFCEDLQELLELNLPQNVLFNIGDWNAKVIYPIIFLFIAIMKNSNQRGARRNFLVQGQSRLKNNVLSFTIFQ